MPHTAAITTHPMTQCSSHGAAGIAPVSIAGIACAADIDASDLPVPVLAAGAELVDAP